MMLMCDNVCDPPQQPTILLRRSTRRQGYRHTIIREAPGEKLPLRTCSVTSTSGSGRSVLGFMFCI